MGWLMEPIYNVISWVLLRWHELWALILPGNGRFLGTSWEWVLAIVFLVVTVRIVLFPIFVKQIKSQRAMQALAPKIRELQAKYKGDQQTLREEVMKLYQTEKVNPLMGCLPMFLQIPVFFGLFHVLRYINPLTTQPRDPDGPPRTLYGWTESLFDGAAGAQLFTAPIPATFADGAEKLAALGSSGGVAPKLVAALLVLIMMFTTFATSRQMILKTGWQAEPQQRMIQRLMLYGFPISLLLSGWYFPIGVIIYWVTQNLVSLGQQQWVLRKYPPIVTTPEAPKSARERAAAATKKQPNAIKRFFLVLPPPPKPAGGEKRGWLSRLTGKAGAGATSTAVAPAEPAPRSLAPRPGAKPRPVTAQPAGTAAEADAAEPQSEPPKPTKSFTAPKPAGKAAPGKAAPAKSASPQATAGKPASTKAAPAKAASSGGAAPAKKTSPTQAAPVEAPDGAAPAAPVRSGGGGAARAGGGGGRTGAPRKSAPRRKGGQPARKGGGKR